MTGIMILQLAGDSLEKSASSIEQHGWDIQVTPIIEYTCNNTEPVDQKCIDASYPTIGQVLSFTRAPRALMAYDIAEADSLVR